MTRLLVDISNLPANLTAADFQFAAWDGKSPSGFTSTTAEPTITMLDNAGTSGSDRVKIEFTNRAIRNLWLRVTVLANLNTGLASNDVFYFGNAVGERNIGNVGTPNLIRINASDTSVVRQNQSASVIQHFGAPMADEATPRISINEPLNLQLSDFDHYFSQLGYE